MRYVNEVSHPATPRDSPPIARVYRSISLYKSQLHIRKRSQAAKCLRSLINGEPVGIRTRDLLIKSQLLYQLSYRPTAALTKESCGGRQPIIGKEIGGL